MKSVEFTDRDIERMLDVAFESVYTDDAQFYRLIDEIETEIQKAIVDVLEEEANKIIESVKHEIDIQPARWEELNRNYREWKEDNELNTDMLKATEQYYKAMGILDAKQDNQGGIEIRAGVPSVPHINKDGEEQDITLPELAGIHEFGTEKIPARPHWYPGFRKWESKYNNLEKDILKKIQEVIIDKLENLFEIDNKTKRAL